MVRAVHLGRVVGVDVGTSCLSATNHVLTLVFVRIGAVLLLVVLVVGSVRVVVGVVAVVLLRLVGMLDVRVVLFSHHVVVLISLLSLLSLGSSVVVGGLGADGHNLRGGVVLAGVQLGGFWLHLENEVTITDVGLRGTEGGRVGVKSGVVALVPPVRVESVEVVPPVEVESISLAVVGEGLDVVVKDVPGHFGGIEALAPRLEGRRPEVHPQRRLLSHILHRGIVSGHVAHLMPINTPADVLRGPLHGVSVPVGTWVKVVGILV